MCLEWSTFGLSASPMNSNDRFVFFSWWNPLRLSSTTHSCLRLGTKEWKDGLQEHLRPKNVHKEVMRKWNQSYGTSTGRYTLHGKRGKRGKERERANEKCPEMTVDGHNLTRCGGCQGYMDFFSEVFCVVRFFFFSFFCTPRNTKMENIFKDWKRAQPLDVTFPNAVS